MDNTLLQSQINFKAMKQEIVNFLVNKGVLPENFPLQEHTTSTIIEYVKEKGGSDAIHEAAMRIAVEYELLGMEGAGLEPEVTNRLDALLGQYVLVIVTNNSHAAAQHFPSIKESEWISIGDSWIDGRASIDAQIPFISYGTTANTMEEKGVKPIAHIDNLLRLLDYV